MTADRTDEAGPREGPQSPEAVRWRCVCAYDGTNFSGWQSQPGGDAVQDVIEKRLAAIAGRPLRIHGSGRTDAGVHAWGQVFHFDMPWRHGAAKLAAALSAGLPPAIQIRRVGRAPNAFHARFSASGKVYRYEIFLGDPDPFSRPYVWARPAGLDVAAMERAAHRLEGRHDFRAFAADTGRERLTTIRDLRSLTITRRGARLRIEAEADGFLYKMVRSIVGALVAVGEKRLGEEEIGRLLHNTSRTHEVPTAPARGLFLVRVLYPRKIRQASHNAMATPDGWE